LYCTRVKIFECALKSWFNAAKTVVGKYGGNLVFDNAVF